MLMSWVSAQPFARSARSSLASVDLKSPGRWNGPKWHTDNIDKKPLHFTPWNGRFYFWHKHHLFIFRRLQKHGELGFTPREEVSISCLGRTPTVLREFLDDCRRHYLGLVQNKTAVFEHQGDKWKPSKSRDKRNISTVIIKENVKNALVKDISEFLNPATRKWYSNRGIPYQRGYLLYGPPGTGKSSFSFSVAGQFDLDIYILSISSLSDNTLKTLFAELPRHCVVLLEDIDVASSKRTGNSHLGLDQNSSSAPATPADATVSLSTLLNVLDGVGSPEGRVLIMTTNHIERLDEALIRPGRTDRKIEFQLVDEEMVAQLFRLVYDGRLGKSVEGGNSTKTPDGTDRRKYDEGDETVKLAEEFAAKVPKNEFSPAEIMSLLLANKELPRQAIDDVDAWMDQIREERKVMKRADSWVTDESSE